MSKDPKDSSTDNNEQKKSIADTGNASDPSPGNEAINKAGYTQLLETKAEKYLREAGNIEDLPDAQDQLDMGNSLSDNTE